MTAIPPPRWKVVERGRRLEVIDTRAEGATPAARGSAPRPGLPRRLRFDGTLGWTTHPAYDERGPRAVVLDGGLARWIGGLAAFLAGVAAMTLAVGGSDGLTILGAVAAMLGASWKGIRRWLTARLDLIAAA